MGLTVVVLVPGSLRLGNGQLLMPERCTNLDNDRARIYCACSRSGRGLFGYTFSLGYHFFFFLPISGMEGCVTCGLNPFQQNFSDIRMLGG